MDLAGSRAVAATISIVIFVLLFVIAVWAGNALQYAGASAWLIVAASLSIHLAIRFMPDASLGGVALSRFRRFSMVFTAALAVQFFGASYSLEQSARRGTEDRLVEAVRRSPGKGTAILHSADLRTLDGVRSRILRQVNSELARRESTSQQENERRIVNQRQELEKRKKLAEERSENPAMLLAGLIGWIANPSH